MERKVSDQSINPLGFAVALLSGPSHRVSVQGNEGEFGSNKKAVGGDQSDNDGGNDDGVDGLTVLARRHKFGQPGAGTFDFVSQHAPQK